MTASPRMSFPLSTTSPPDAGTKGDRLSRGDLPVVHRLLDGNGAEHRVEGALEFDEEGVSYRLDLSPSVAGEERTKQAAVLLQRLKGGGLVLLGERGISHDVLVHYPSETSLAYRHYGPFLAQRGWVDDKMVCEGPCFGAERHDSILDRSCRSTIQTLSGQ